MQINDIIEEVSNLAESLSDSNVFFKSQQAMEGIEAIQQAAIAFIAAENDAERKDAALWVGEAYLLLSAGLPDTGTGEQNTGWATARQIAQLLGGPESWEKRVIAQYLEGS